MAPLQGEVWLVDLDPVRGHEQAGRRPALVLSVDKFNQGPAGLAIVVPITGTDRQQPLHVAIEPPEGGMRKRSFAKPEDIRSVASARLVTRWGRVAPDTLRSVVERVRLLIWVPG